MMRAFWTNIRLRPFAPGLVTLAATVASSLAQAQPGRVSDNVVRLGILGDMSGPYSALGGRGSVVAAQMAVEDAGSSVLGAPVEVVSADHQNKPDVAAGFARNWFDTQGVDAVFDLLGSNVALSVVAVANAKHRIAFVNGAATTRLTNDACTPITVDASWDSYSQSHGLVGAITSQGGESWFFITVDNAGGSSLENEAAETVTKSGGKVLGSVRYPLGTVDFSSFMLRAQESRAKMIGLITSGADTVNAVKSANEFGIVGGGQTLVGLGTFITEIHGLGLQIAQGMLLNEYFYWDHDETTRAFARRFFEKNGTMPSGLQAAIYSNVTHYLKAIRAAGTDEAAAVMAEMRKLPVDDIFKGRLRKDGRMMFDNYLVQVKTPSQSKYHWDYYVIKAVIPAEQAYQPISASTCPMVRR